MSHIPVLLQPFLDTFKSKKISCYLDATLGAGGHAEAILTAHPEIEQFIGFDQDPVAIALAKERLAPFGDKVKIIANNFSAMAEELARLDQGNPLKFDGIFFDLGVSSMQIDTAERGFSFMRDGPLDMRMNPDGLLTAEDIVNDWPERELGLVLARYGEVKQWRAMARKICREREKGRITSTLQLAAIVDEKLPFRRTIHPATLLFQGLRIAVNRELERIETVLPVALERLNPGGYLGVISFHSLEDRIVKNTFKEAASDKLNTASSIVGLFVDKDPDVKLLTRKPLIADEEEIRSNPRARSAKLRFVEKLDRLGER